MKCPKCGYIGFEPTARCRNCGYDFSLSDVATEGPGLPLASRDPAGPLGDLRLHTPTSPRKTPTPGGRFPRGDHAGAGGRIGREGSDLPLFDETGEAEEAPLIPLSQPPRTPIVVRRPTPSAARLRASRREAEQPELDLSEAPQVTQADRHQPGSKDATHRGAGAVASGARRVAAAGLDALLLAGVDLVVVYFTLRMCRLASIEAGILPMVPLIAFLLIIAGGYILAFTLAGGQTIGKMAVGIRVVDVGGSPVTPRQAALRTMAAIVLTVPLGASFLPCLLGSAHRALHDRVSGTQVVPA